jgi:phosphoadenosine phosphosulfate reductase
MPQLNQVQSEFSSSNHPTLTLEFPPQKLINLDLPTVNKKLNNATAIQVVEWAGETFGPTLVMSTSFGIQAAVMLHLVVTVIPDIPVIWIDTGYLPPETYRFAQQLTERLNLNLKVYQSPLSPARMEALYGRLWDQRDVESLNLYDQIRKVEPMQRALQELNAQAWLAGLRSNQTQHRQNLSRVNFQNNQFKILPILDWTSRDIYQYLTKYDLPYHPFFDLGYVSVGDWHSSRPLTADDQDERDTRFHGLKQECGLHLPLNANEAQSLDSSTL